MFFQEVPARFLSRPLVGIKCIALACIYRAILANSTCVALLKKSLSYMVRNVQSAAASAVFGISPEALCSLQNARYSHRAYYIQFPPMGVTGTWQELH